MGLMIDDLLTGDRHCHCSLLNVGSVARQGMDDKNENGFRGDIEIELTMELLIFALFGVQRDFSVVGGEMMIKNDMMERILLNQRLQHVHRNTTKHTSIASKFLSYVMVFQPWNQYKRSFRN